ncbi:conserved Plasmodium protein, unknown function [Plasmodium knowlesi strain H]|uniref:Merozoite surface protein 7 n=3 Tax=Plasmodium knowlesi TaxID=5850 RepID=A0A5K1U778_PLAKH|nr:conserved Plasmodium protein, unknown function [Plasmodium knowlesi strain H]OTN66150.1 Uncharacterized protein PKNOH_S09532700 [Plasmodium knowlesi]CAA9989980.1 conserved Plasmodium protein, unknown function [Plasmodium knowlesi strain H]SBO24569.1 conserved Plasmodium protein, unknown function [Plasmodium knowlesi strain H]SBO26312.1 conserved Plasmodium protein, unknown function [Plasmodium knowlesi strain H]VVS79454.1 conserved Plasmodium protein, unknown function [Plasmodium knowlesi s|eukprot:XP_002259995.1 hypothetical protein, conserved in Plasmodium species [Plasmodium knowlesi strain H]
MRKNIILLGSILMLLSLQYVLPGSIIFKKKRNKMEDDALSLVHRRLENLYKLSAWDNSEVFAKEIESMKEYINTLKDGGWENIGGNCSAILEKNFIEEVGKYADMLEADEEIFMDCQEEFFEQREIESEGSKGCEDASGDVINSQVVGRTVSGGGQ